MYPCGSNFFLFCHSYTSEINSRQLLAHNKNFKYFHFYDFNKNKYTLRFTTNSVRFEHIRPVEQSWVLRRCARVRGDYGTFYSSLSRHDMLRIVRLGQNERSNIPCEFQHNLLYDLCNSLVPFAGRANHVRDRSPPWFCTYPVSTPISDYCTGYRLVHLSPVCMRTQSIEVKIKNKKNLPFLI